MQSMESDEIIQNPLKGEELLNVIAKWATIMKIRENQGAHGITSVGEEGGVPVAKYEERRAAK